VKVLCSEGIATNTGPQSCVVHRKAHGETLTGESVGQLLSRESINSVQCAGWGNKGQYWNAEV